MSEQQKPQEPESSPTPVSGEPKSFRHILNGFLEVNLGTDEATVAENERGKLVENMLAENTARAAFEEWLDLMAKRREGQDIDPDLLQAARDHHLESQANLRQLTQPQIIEEPPTTG